MVGRVIVCAPHDLLRIDATAFDGVAALPPWAGASLARTPWVVVRRACAGGTIPVGIRGVTRTERHGARVAPACVCAIVTPASLVARIPLGGNIRSIDRAACALRDAAHDAGLALGLAGSYGFELATGTVVTHAASDIDAIVGATDRAIDRATLRTFATACDAIETVTGVRIDVEVALPCGGTALRDAIGAATTILVKTDTGPVLVPCLP